MLKISEVLEYIKSKNSRLIGGILICWIILIGLVLLTIHIFTDNVAAGEIKTLKTLNPVSITKDFPSYTVVKLNGDTMTISNDGDIIWTKQRIPLHPKNKLKTK